MSDTQRSQGREQILSRYWKWAAVVVAGAFLIGLVVAFFSITVCDYELAQNSSAIKVCRHLEITDPPAAAVGIAVIALLGAVFGEISAFGVTVRQKVDKLENRTNELDAGVQRGRDGGCARPRELRRSVRKLAASETAYGECVRSNAEN